MIPALVRGAMALGRFAKGAKAAGDVVKNLSEKVMDFGNNVDRTAKKIIHAADLISKRWVLMQDTAFQTARTMAMSREQAMRYNEHLIKSTKELAAQYGVTAKEMADFQKSYSEAVGRNVILSRQQLAHMSALAKITDNATAGQLVDEFDKIGVGIAGTTAKVGLMQERAKALGINATKATKILKDNIQQAAKYSFRNGVNDIEKMSLKAASMRMDMNAIMSATEKFRDIESAIGTSANIQMLGGSFAREFSNPMGAMFESMADPKAFQERILRTIQGKGTYDAKTGAVTFDPVTMRMMQELAKNLNMSVDQITNPAMAQVQNQKVDEELRAKGTYDKWAKNPEMLAAIQNLSRTNVDEETGKHYVTLLDDGKQRRVNIEDLTERELKIAQDSQMTEEGLWNDVQDIKTILERVHGRARDTKSVKEAEEGIQSWWDAQITNIQDIWMKPISGIYNGISNWLGKQYFASGGIAKPVHAEIGTIVPGTSYHGDRVPAMLNSGEMVLNQQQQKSMFNLISSLALNGGAMYGVNKLGGKFGVGGLGSTMLMANVLGGGDTGVKEMVEAHFLKKFLKNMMPLKKSIDGVSTAAETATKTTSAFKTHWGEFTNTLSKDWGTLTTKVSKKWGDFSKNVSASTRKFFTTGRLGELTSRLQELPSLAKGKLTQASVFTAKHAKIIGEAVGKYTIKPIETGAKLLYNSKPAQYLVDKTQRFGRRTKIGYNRLVKPRVERVVGSVQTANYQAHLGYKQYVKPKAQEYSKLIKNLFNTGSGAQASKAASMLQTPEVAMTGRNTGVAKASATAAKEASTSVSNAVGKSGKLLSGLGKAGKVIGKKIPYIGTALAIGGAVSGIADASSQYDKKIDEIESSGMSQLEKARAKDRATKEKNASYGGSVGSAAGGLGGMAAGAAAGAAIGSVVPVIGTAIGGLIGGALGAWGGEKLGGSVGKGIGGLFGGSEEDKFKKKQEEREKAEIKQAGIKSKSLESIERNVSIIAGRRFGIGARQLNTPSIKKIGGKMISTVPGLGLAGLALSSLSSKDKKGAGGIDLFKGLKTAFKYSAPGMLLNTLSAKSPIEKMKDAMKMPAFEKKLGQHGIKQESTYVSPIEKLKSNISLEPKETKISAIPDNSTFLKVRKTAQETSSKPNISLDKTNINLNVSGTIKLEGGGKSVDFDLAKLIDTPEFKRQLADIVTRRINESSNSGKRNMESERNNMAAQYNKSGK